MNVKNLSLGGTAALQNLYELTRNYQILKTADLIINASNVHDIVQYNSPELFSKSYQVIHWLYKELYFLNKKVLCFITPTPQKWLNQQCSKLVYALHKKLIKNYGFNIIDLNGYYLEKNLYDFIRRDEAHDFDFIMREIGEKIADNIENFSFPKNINIKNDNPKFIALNAREMQKINESNFKNKASWLCQEEIYELKNELEFKKIYHNYIILGAHVWNEQNNYEFKIGDINKDNSFSRNIDSQYSFFFDIYNRNIKITGNTTILSKNNPIGFIGFLLASPEGNYHNEDIDFESLAEENIEIDEEYNFNHLIPRVEWYKEIIDEYCSIIDPIKQTPLQNQINTLNTQISNLTDENIQMKGLIDKKYNLEILNLEQDLIIKKLESKKLAKSLGIKMDIINPKVTFIQANSAKARIQNQLSYKLGQAMIENSKSILGYIRMPYVLSYIKDKHKQEQKIYEEKIKKDPSLKLPPLESYPDYQEALKEKECFTYKLGEALIRANNNWYGGGYIKLWFEI
ncbi:hypothetical protein, partial [Campylobacter estrildidarum]|uniref:hypothetical protein n=1 Tax=Campylobacter estrildidarum TaxID=2510189 RepID=UPI001FE75358